MNVTAVTLLKDQRNASSEEYWAVIAAQLLRELQEYLDESFETSTPRIELDAKYPAIAIKAFKRAKRPLDVSWKTVICLTGYDYVDGKMIVGIDAEFISFFGGKRIMSAGGEAFIRLHYDLDEGWQNMGWEIDANYEYESWLDPP